MWSQLYQISELRANIIDRRVYKESILDENAFKGKREAQPLEALLCNLGKLVGSTPEPVQNSLSELHIFVIISSFADNSDMYLSFKRLLDS
jgi:hypothetical protein